MTFTRRDYDRILQGGGHMPRGVITLLRVLKPVFWVLARIGFVRRWVGRTTGPRLNAISQCRKRGEYDKGLALAIDALKAFRHRKPGRFDSGTRHFAWWGFMNHAACCLQKCDDPVAWETVIALARDGIEPVEGYYAAYSFHTFARKKLAERDYGAAVEFATLSAAADETWAESDLLLGWYELEIGGGDAFEHLRRAVRKDQGALARIADDPVFQKHPDLIEGLKETLKFGLTH